LLLNVGMLIAGELSTAQRLPGDSGFAAAYPLVITARGHRPGD